MPRPIKEEQTDFSGGLNLVSDPYRLKKNQVYRVLNLVLEQHGALVTRDGYRILTSSPEDTFPIRARGYLNVSSPLGTSFEYAVLNNTTTNETRLYITSTEPWTLVGTFPDANGLADIPQTATMLDNEVFALGNFITPYVWDGTTISPIGSEPEQERPAGAAHCIYHLGALWLWNTSQGTTDLDGASSLRQSDINNFNSWPTEFQTFVGKNDGQQGQGLATFTIAETGISPTQTLVLFKDFSTYQVTGTFAASNFAVQKVKSDMGCIAPRTVQFVSGYGVIRLTHKGFAVFDGVNDQIISEEIRPLIFGDPDGIFGNPGDPVDFASVRYSYATQTGKPPMYVAACPVIGSEGQLTRFFVYDLIRRAWTILDFPINFSWLGTLYRSGEQPGIQAGTMGEALVSIVSLFDGNQNDNGLPIEWSLTTRPFTFGSFMDDKFFRRGVLSMAAIAPIPVTVITTYSGGPPAQTKLVTLDAGVGHNDTRMSFDMMRVSPAIYSMAISGTGIVSIRGISVQGTQRPISQLRR